MSLFRVTPAVRIAALAIVLAGAVLWQYGSTLSYGLVYDDYHFIRPYARAEVAAAFADRWDRAGIEPPFYRPLTIAFFAARFHLLRFDPTALHALSLVLFAIAGAIGAALVSRLARSATAGWWFAAFWVVHPNLPVSLVAWLTNQMHLLQVVICLSGLWLWSIVKDRGAAWWTPLLVLQAAAFMVKEDGVLLLPVVLVGHVLYRTIVDRGLRWPPLAIVVAGGLLIGGLLVLRHEALGGLGGYTARPDRDRMLVNLAKGLERAVLLRPARLPILQWQAWFVTLALPLGLVAAWRARQRASAFLILFGLAIAFFFNLPFALISKAEQYYLVATGGIVAIAAAVDVLVRVLPRWPRAGVAIATVVTLFCMQQTGRGLTENYAPSGPETLRTDAIVTEWAAVPIEIRAWIPVKGQPPNTGNLARDLPCVTYGLHGAEKDFYHRVYRWTQGHVRIFVNPRTPFVTFGLQPLLIGQPRRPFGVRVSVEGRTVSEQTLADEREAAFSIPMPAPDSSSLRPRELDLFIDRTWTPGRGDDRTLGVKLYDLDCSPAVAR
jgi:hypothetical protein